MAASIHIEPRLMLTKRISAGLRYDVGLFGFGEQRIGERNTQYRVIQPDLSLLRSAAVLTYFHFKILGADFNTGLGLEYTRTADRAIRTYNKSNSLLADIDDTEGHHKIYPTIAFGVDLGPSFFTAKFATYNRGSTVTISEAYLNLSMGYTILGERTGWRMTKKAERIPVFFLEFGSQFMLPTSNKKYAGSIGAFVEPKIAISKNSSIGFRYEFDRGRNKGLDLEFGIRNTSNGEMRELRRLNALAYTHGLVMTYDYYFPTRGGWYFIGTGLGQYSRDEMNDFGNGFFFGSSFSFDPIPEQKNIGGLIRVGMKTSLFRFTLGYSYTGKNIPDYFSFQVGFEPSFLKNKN